MAGFTLGSFLGKFICFIVGLEVEVSLYPMYAKVTDISCFNSGVLSTVSGILDFSTLLDMVLT